MAQSEVSVGRVPFGQVCLIAEAYVLASSDCVVELEDMIEAISDLELFLKVHDHQCTHNVFHGRLWLACSALGMQYRSCQVVGSMWTIGYCMQ